AVDDRVEAALQQADEVLAGVAAAALGLGVVTAELLLADVAVVALQLLLGRQLGAVVGRLAAALAVLAGGVVSLVDGALGPAPEIDAEAAIDLVLGRFAFGHGACHSFRFGCRRAFCRRPCCSGRPRISPKNSGLSAAAPLGQT